MTWEQKLQACAAIGTGISLRMRKPGDWYVDHRSVAISDGMMLSGRYGNGITPEEAVNEHFDVLTKIPSGKAIYQRRPSDSTDSYVRWNGFMWENVSKP